MRRPAASDLRGHIRRTTMADPGNAASSARLLVSVAALATTLGGSLALAIHDPQPAESLGVDTPLLAPLPTLESVSGLPDPIEVPARRPNPIAVTRSSR
jgi:hypothetical protein